MGSGGDGQRDEFTTRVYDIEILTGEKMEFSGYP